MPNFDAMTTPQLKTYARTHYSSMARLTTRAALLRALKKMTGVVMEIQSITFEVHDMENGFFVEFEIDYSEANLAAVLLMHGSRNIRILPAA